MSKKNLLDVNYFADQEDFKYELVRLHNNDDPHHPFDDEEFVKRRYAHACKTSEGYKEWVYPIYLLLHDSLAGDIKEKVAGAQTGDLLDLVASINIAIRHFEMFDPTTLEIALWSKRCHAVSNKTQGSTDQAAPSQPSSQRCKSDDSINQGI